MYYIFPTQQLADELAGAIEHGLIRHKLQPLDQKTLYRRSVEIVIGYLRDNINTRLAYAQPTDHGDLLFIRMFLLPEDPMPETTRDDLWAEIVDETWIKINAWVSEYVPENNYYTWAITKHGLDNLVIRGEDFRILDWTRRMKSGVWPSPMAAMADVVDWKIAVKDENLDEPFYIVLD